MRQAKEEEEEDDEEEALYLKKVLNEWEVINFAPLASRENLAKASCNHKLL